MEALLRDKFRRHAALRAQLAATRRKPLLHANDYNDTFWGVVRDAKATERSAYRGFRGSNELGRALERVGARSRRVRRPPARPTDTVVDRAFVCFSRRSSSCLSGREVVLR